MADITLRIEEIAIWVLTKGMSFDILTKLSGSKGEKPERIDSGEP